jgi:hypothetical protein
MNDSAVFVVPASAGPGRLKAGLQTLSASSILRSPQNFPLRNLQAELFSGGKEGASQRRRQSFARTGATHRFRA